MIDRAVLMGLVFAFVFLHGQVHGKAVKIIYPIRLEETIATHEKANEPFFRTAENTGALNHTVSLVLDGIRKGLLKPLSISEDTWIVRTMAYDEWLGRIQRYGFELKTWQATMSYKVDGDVYGSNQCIFKGKTYVSLKNSKGKQPNLFLGTYWNLLSDNLMTACEFGLIRLDITQGKTFDGKIVEQVNFLTFYDDEKASANGLVTPRFSIKWSSFIDFLDKYHSDKLYYRTVHQFWLANDIFVTHNTYIDKPFSFLPKGPLYLENKANGERLILDHLASQYGSASDGVIDARDDTIKIKVKQGQNQKVEIYSLPLQEYLKVMKDSNSQSIVYTLADAWRMKLFVYDESVKLVYGGDVDAMRKDMTISKNGYFVKSKKPDPLCGGKIVPSFNSRPSHQPVAFTLLELWDVSLTDTSNIVFESGAMPLQALLASYVWEGKIKSILTYDTVLQEKISNATAQQMKNYSTIKQLKQMLVMPVFDYNKSEQYHKGDVVRNGHFNYKAMVEPNGRGPGDEGIYKDTVWKKVDLVFYNTEQLYHLGLYLQRRFGLTDKKSSREIQYIELSLPASESLKGIRVPIFLLNWKAVKGLLEADPRAVVEHHGEKRNYAELLEKSSYEGWLVKTGFLRASK